MYVPSFTVARPLLWVVAAPRKGTIPTALILERKPPLFTNPAPFRTSASLRHCAQNPLLYAARPAVFSHSFATRRKARPVVLLITAYIVGRFPNHAMVYRRIIYKSETQMLRVYVILTTRRRVSGEQEQKQQRHGCSIGIKKLAGRPSASSASLNNCQGGVRNRGKGWQMECLQLAEGEVANNDSRFSLKHSFSW